MFKYDTTHGPYKGHVESAPGALIVDGHNIQSFSEKYASSERCLLQVLVFRAHHLSVCLESSSNK